MAQNGCDVVVMSAFRLDVTSKTGVVDKAYLVHVLAGETVSVQHQGVEAAQHLLS